MLSIIPVLLLGISVLSHDFQIWKACVTMNIHMLARGSCFQIRRKFCKAALVVGNNVKFSMFNYFSGNFSVLRFYLYILRLCQVCFTIFCPCNKNFFQKFKLRLLVLIFVFHNILQVYHYYNILSIFFHSLFLFYKLYFLISLILYMVLLFYLQILQNENVQYLFIVLKLCLLFQILQSGPFYLHILFVFVVTSLYYLLHLDDMKVISLLVHMLVVEYYYLD